MPVHAFERPRGRLVEITVQSEALATNRLGDPTARTVAVYLPEGYDDTYADYPLFVDLAAFTGSGLKRLAWTAFGVAASIAVGTPDPCAILTAGAGHGVAGAGAVGAADRVRVAVGPQTEDVLNADASVETLIDSEPGVVTRNGGAFPTSESFCVEGT